MSSSIRKGIEPPVVCRFVEFAALWDWLSAAHLRVVAVKDGKPGVIGPQTQYPTSGMANQACGFEPS